MGCGASKVSTNESALNVASTASTISVKANKENAEEDNPFLDPPTDGSLDRIVHKKSTQAPKEEEKTADDALPTTKDQTVERFMHSTENGNSRAHKKDLSSKAEEKENDADDLEEEEVEDTATQQDKSSPTTKEAIGSPAASTKHSKDKDKDTTSTLSRFNTFGSLAEAQPASYDLNQPNILTSNLGAVFLHYAQKRYDPGHHRTSSTKDDIDLDEEKIDKKALSVLAHDCVLAFMAALKKDMLKVKETARSEEENYQRRKMLPGETLEEVMDLSLQYLKAEMIYKNGHVTRTCFFFHFPRAFKSMFFFEKMTLERENLVAKWNKIGKESAKEKKSSKEKDKEDKKKKRKDRKTAPMSAAGDLLANLAQASMPADSKLIQAERKLKAAAKAHSSQRNLLKDVE